MRRPAHLTLNPRRLNLLVGVSSMQADIKGDIYEGLLAKSAESERQGASRRFVALEYRRLAPCRSLAPRTDPWDRRLRRSDSRRYRLRPRLRTGGFLLAAYDHVVEHYDMDKDQKRHLKSGFAHGWELVPNTARLCVMNLYLHGIESDPCPIHAGADALAGDPGERFSLILTNPPFGKKSSIAIVNEEGELEKESSSYERQDFWTTTKNKQLNFLQHVKTLLEVNGRCAIVVPDNVLFEGGAGETVRRNLLQQCDVHTLLRLPTGILCKVHTQIVRLAA